MTWFSSALIYFLLISGNPFSFIVTDISHSSARGDAFGLIKCNQATSFVLTAPGAQQKDIEVNISGWNIDKSLIH